MKKLILTVLFCLMMGNWAWAVTAFTVTVAPSAGDYTSLNAALVANEVNLTVATTKVFALTGGITGTMTDNTAVTGVTSGATGTCVHASSVNGQILIKSISGTFQNGEIVYENLGTNYVTLGDAGASPYLNVKIDGTWSSADTTAVTITGYTTNATNYVNIYTTPTARHTGTVSSGYMLYPSVAGSAITNPEGSGVYYITGLIIKVRGGTQFTAGIKITGGHTGYISKNIITIDSPSANVRGTYSTSSNDTYYIWDNIIYGFSTGGYGIGLTANTSLYYVYNNTIYNCLNGVLQSAGTAILKNNIAYNNTTSDYSGTFDSSSTNNLSSDATVPAYGTYYANATVTFNNAGSGDFSLASTDTGATGHGANLSADSNLPFTDDITGATRSVPWDIGAFKASGSAPVNHGFARFLN